MKMPSIVKHLVHSRKEGSAKKTEDFIGVQSHKLGCLESAGKIEDCIRVRSQRRPSLLGCLEGDGETAVPSGAEEEDKRLLLSEHCDRTSALYTGVDNTAFTCVTRTKQTLPDIVVDAQCFPVSSPPQLQSSGSNYFVFILAADPERKSELRVQVSAVSERLKEKKIPHVIVTSLSLRPTVELPPHIKTDLPDLILPASHQSDWNSRQKSSIVTFVQFALKKAGNVLILVSPGYFRYADPYSEGAEETSDTVQRLIRKCHSKLKQEFFHSCTRSKTLRIWPVLLCDMNAVRAHIPSFLSDSMFYTYPSRTDDFVLLLKITMSDSACQRISNLRIQSG